MSMNKYMHPRNVYKKPPDFKELAIIYEEFREVATMDLNGKVFVNFKDPKVLRTLTKCLLKKDFNLDILLPQDKLVPTLPLRLNYILWIEDICNTFSLKNVKGIDIGCGASCIYPLLLARLQNWTMYALETNQESFEAAAENIKTNGTDDQIVMVKQEESDAIFKNIPFHDISFDFCMCNPPFFNSKDDLDYNLKNQNRSGRRNPPKNFKTGHGSELFIEGGETKFVEQMLGESIILKNKIKIYTTMLGHKSSVGKIIELFKRYEITNFIKTEFCQGHTTRWGIAWTFEEHFNMKLIPIISTASTHNTNIFIPVKYEITHEKNLENIKKSIKLIFNELNLKSKILNENLTEIIWEIEAIENTWSHQRRKKREILRKSLSIVENEKNLEVEQVCNQSKVDNNKPHILRAAVTIKQLSEGNLQLEIRYLSGIVEKDGVHQILQFIINKWKDK